MNPSLHKSAIEGVGWGEGEVEKEGVGVEKLKSEKKWSSLFFVFFLLLPHSSLVLVTQTEGDLLAYPPPQPIISLFFQSTNGAWVWVYQAGFKVL